MLAGLRRLCREAAAHTDAPLLELRGLESVLLDSSPLVALLDRPRIPPHEIAQEIPRADWRCASLNPNPNPTLTANPTVTPSRWVSLLQKAELEQLADACPGAASLDGIRKACVGYFIAE